MPIEPTLSIDFELPEVTGELVEHDYSSITPAEAFRLFEEQNKAIWESNAPLNRGTPCEKPFVME